MKTSAVPMLLYLFLSQAALLLASASAVMNHKPSRCDVDRTPHMPDLANTAFADVVRSVRLPDSGRTYRYVSVRARRNKPTLLFLHGFPSSLYDWRHQIEFFRAHGYGLIVPDLLGYGGTDKPEELEAYRFRAMAEQLVEILDCEGVRKVVGISHDLYAETPSSRHPESRLKLPVVRLCCLVWRTGSLTGSAGTHSSTSAI